MPDCAAGERSSFCVFKDALWEQTGVICTSPGPEYGNVAAVLSEEKRRLGEPTKSLEDSDCYVRASACLLEMRTGVRAG